MKRSSYREHDYEFGQLLLTLRSAIGLTQAGLAQALGVSRRSVADWEAGSKYPKAAHLTQFIALAVTHQAFHVGHEADDIRALWKAAHQKVLLNEMWLSDLLSDTQVTRSRSEVERTPAADRAVAAPMRAEQKLTSSLPFQPTTFVGRSTELAAIVRLLANPACRLLTLHGPGGIGKTRLALAVAASDAAAFPDGVAFVALASISMPSQIVSAIGEALRLSFVGQSDPTSHLLSELRERHMLLVLDNFEHLLEGADLVSDILAQAPQVTVVVTTRERLNLQAEWLFNVDGLALPQQQLHAPATAQNLATLAAYSAVELFIQRARQVQPELAIDEATLTTIVQICQHVAGMPLAIELAAAGLRSLPLSEIQRQIGAHLDVLATTSRDLPARHRSMRAVFDHSWRLLSEQERALFSHLAVFRGGWTLEAAAEVAGATLPTLAGLVDKSLVRLMSAGARSTALPHATADSRFTLLEPIREYALEQLALRGEAEALQRRHATYYMTMAEAVPGQLDNPTQDTVTAQLDREHDNIRAALQWACDEGDVRFGLQLGVSLWRFWRRGGYLSEGRVWLERLLARADDTADASATTLRLRAIDQAAWLATDQHDFRHAALLFEQAKTLRRALGQTEDDTPLLVNTALQARALGQYQRSTTLLEDAVARHRVLNDSNSESVANMGLALYMLALILREQGDFARSEALFKEGIEFYRQLGDREGIAQGQLGLSDLARDQGAVAQIRQDAEQNLVTFQEFGTQWAIGFTLNNLALAAYLDHDSPQAFALSSESVALFRQLHADSNLAEVLITLGQIVRAQGDNLAAYGALTEALRLALAVGPRLMVAAALEGLASVVVAQGHAELGVRLLAAASALREQMGTPMRLIDQAAVEQALATARSILGEEAFAAVWAEAQALPVEQILSGLPSVAALTAGGLAATERDTPADVPLLRLAGERAVNEPPLILPTEGDQPTMGDQQVTSSLPSQPTSFVGRAAELAEFARILGNPACRLLTLLGPGGIGKTRLALEVAATHTTAFPDGVAFVALASVSTSNQIVSTIGESLHLDFAGQPDPTAHLRSYLRERHMLLVLDNFEHLLAGADLLSTILERAPHLTLLVTSRERLNLQAEWLFDVDGLDFPSEDPHGSAASQSLADLADYSAVQLFVQRAMQVQPRLSLSELALTTIVRICQHVAGMPLAIELAAAGLRTLSLAEIEQQIRANLDGLAVSYRDVPERHRSCRAVFDHSLNLLSEEERALFSHLAVFRGGWTAEAAEQVAGAMLPALAVLVDKSLVRFSAEPRALTGQVGPNAAAASRFVMLEPLREYALAHLAARGEAAALGRAHASYYLALAEAAMAQWDTPTVDSAIALLDRELDNLRAALHWARDGGESTLGLQLAGALWRFWRIRGYYSEGRVWLEELLALDEDPSDATALAARLRALDVAAWLAADQRDYMHAAQLFEQSTTLRRTMGETEGETNLLGNAALQARAEGQYQRARALLEDAVARHRALGDRGGIGSAGLGLSLYMLGSVRREQGDFAGAAVMFEECLELHRVLGDREGMAQALLGLGDIARDQGDAAQLRRYCEESLALVRKLGVQWAIGFLLNNLALAAYYEGDLTNALGLVNESVALFRAHNADGSLAEVLITLGQILRAQGDGAEAHAALTEALRLAQAVGPRLLVAVALEGLVNVVVAQGHAELAARLLAAASALRAEMGTPMRPVDQAAVEQALATARSILGEEAFAAVWAEAQTLPVEQILSGLPSVAALTAGGLAATERDTPADVPPLRLAGERAVDEPPLTLPPFFATGTPPRGPAVSFVAREQELAELAAALATAHGGAGQVLFVIGGAGRGKTTLVQEFARQAQAADPEVLVVSGSCNAHTGSGDPYLPFREALTLLSGEVEARWAGGLISAEHAQRLWEAMPLTLPALVEHAPDLLGTFVPSNGVRERAATFAGRDAPWFRELVARESVEAGARVAQQPIVTQYSAALSAIARERPLLLILEDLHWVDSASSGLLVHLSREAARSRMLILGTYRPDEVAVSRGEMAHPLAEMLSELKRWHGDIWLDLGELAEADGRHFVEAYLDTQPNRLGSAFREALFHRTGGHALFTVELMREMRERGDVRQDADGQWIDGPAIDWNTLPARVEGVIEKRIQRLETELRTILTIASVEGETFTAEVVARVQQLNERALVQRLSGELDKQHRLVRAHSLAWLGTQRLSLYRFRHQLFQHYVYHSLAEIERAYLHEAVGSVLEALYGAQTEHIAVQLARHFEQAGLTEKAVTYLLQASKRAARLSANQEVIAHVSKGLALLNSLPDTPERAQTELELQIVLGNALMVTKGYGAVEVEQTYSRAWQLCHQLYAGETAQLFPILYGRWGYYVTRGEHQTAYQLAEEFFDLAQQHQDPAMIVAHRCMGWSFCLGELVAARPHFEQIAALYNVEQHRPLTFQYGQDPGPVGLSVGAIDLWLLGYPEQARRWSDRAVMLAREAAHPYTLAAALGFSSWFHHFCQDRAVAQEQAEEAIAIATKQGLALWLAWETIIQGWALVEQGHGDAGIAQIHQGLAAARAVETALFRTHQLTLLTEAYQRVGETEAGLAVLDEAAAQVEQTGERFWEAEIYRLKGELLLKVKDAGHFRSTAEAMQDADSPEGCFLKAIEIARRQEGKSLELRATVSLCRLWQQQGKKDEARHMLAGIYGWFTEGFDTIDLQQAQALLQELSA